MAGGEVDDHVVELPIKLKVPPGEEFNGSVLLKNLYLSCDPYMRGVKHSDTATTPQDALFSSSPRLLGYGVSQLWILGIQRVEGRGLGLGDNKVEQYTLITNTQSFFKINHTDVPLSYYTGLLGMPGMTAYAGFYQVCNPKKGEYVYVSSAFGAVGQIVGQFAKLMGCYVVGKCWQSRKVLLNMRLHGRIAVCAWDDFSVQLRAARGCHQSDASGLQAHSHGRLLRQRFLPPLPQLRGPDAAFHQGSQDRLYGGT
ncbi:hypothetical protein M0R45_002912 [Rubus argutus]|uniref:15-oxoprostaglandin 13-reductase n=1 Tax=Rubus argutus TaxID=59490 RepID=A0AAW1YDI2_RUBAR